MFTNGLSYPSLQATLPLWGLFRMHARLAVLQLKLPWQRQGSRSLCFLRRSAILTGGIYLDLDANNQGSENFTNEKREVCGGRFRWTIGHKAECRHARLEEEYQGVYNSTVVARWNRRSIYKKRGWWQALQAKNATSLNCRTHGHAWQPLSISHYLIQIATPFLDITIGFFGSILGALGIIVHDVLVWQRAFLRTCLSDYKSSLLFFSRSRWVNSSETSTKVSIHDLHSVETSRDFTYMTSKHWVATTIVLGPKFCCV